MTTHFFRCSSCQCSLMVTEKPAAGSGQPSTYMVTPCRRCCARSARDAAHAAVEAQGAFAEPRAVERR